MTAPTTATPSGAVHATAAALPPLPKAPQLPVPRRRRRPALLALAVAMVAAGAVLAGWLANTAGSRVEVLAIARAVPYGAQLTGADLRVARVAADPALAPIPAAARNRVLARRAAAELTPGTLLTEAQLTDTVVPAPGYTLVGLAVKSSQLPAQPLQPQDRVLVVSTPPVDGDVPASAPPTIEARLVQVGRPDDTGTLVVDVTVPEAEAPQLAARAATGRIALVLRARGQ